MKAKICLIAPYKQLKHTASQVIRAMKADTDPAPDIKVVCCPIQKSVALAKELKAPCSFWGIPTQEFIIDGNRYDVDWEAIRVQAQNMIDRHKISLVIGDNVVSRLNLQARHIRDDQENHSPCFT